jgi:hypothetical protein
LHCDILLCGNVLQRKKAVSRFFLRGSGGIRTGKRLPKEQK